VLVACNGPKEIEPVVRADAWTVVPLERDPYAEHHPGTECPPASFGVEDLGGEDTFFINVQDCAYLTIEQPSLVEVEKDDLLRIRLWHFRLQALGASTATITMTIGGEPILDEKIPIPSDSKLIATINPIGLDAEAGSPVVFHLRNHGNNSYNLIEVSRGGEP
jgi:hypothetical protein